MLNVNFYSLGNVGDGHADALYEGFKLMRWGQLCWFKIPSSAAHSIYIYIYCGRRSDLVVLSGIDINTRPDKLDKPA